MRRTDREVREQNDLTDILHKADTCHLALLDGDKPYMIALNYGFVWTGTLPELYFHCAKKGKKLDLVALDGTAFFMVDTDHRLVEGPADCDWGMDYASVAGEGIVSVIEDIAERKAGLDAIMRHYSGRTEFSYDERVFAMTTILRLTVTSLSGKRKSS